jgi:hypothetical protein
MYVDNLYSEYERLLGVAPSDMAKKLEPFGWYAFDPLCNTIAKKN